MNKAAAAKVGLSVVRRKLMREIRPQPGMPIWRQGEDGRNISLVITRAGRDAVGIDEGSTSGDAQRGDRQPSIAAPRTGSKQALVVELLATDKGDSGTRHQSLERKALPFYKLSKKTWCADAATSAPRPSQRHFINPKRPAPPPRRRWKNRSAPPSRHCIARPRRLRQRCTGGAIALCSKASKHSGAGSILSGLTTGIGLF
jgi:hypothetical protein